MYIDSSRYLFKYNIFKENENVADNFNVFFLSLDKIEDSNKKKEQRSFVPLIDKERQGAFRSWREIIHFSSWTKIIWVISRISKKNK